MENRWPSKFSEGLMEWVLGGSRGLSNPFFTDP